MTDFYGNWNESNILINKQDYLANGLIKEKNGGEGKTNKDGNPTKVLFLQESNYSIVMDKILLGKIWLSLTDKIHNS